MRFALFVCADFESCGRPFMAVDGSGRIHCPYCRELGERVDDPFDPLLPDGDQQVNRHLSREARRQIRNHYRGESDECT